MKKIIRLLRKVLNILMEPQDLGYYKEFPERWELVELLNSLNVTF